MENDVISSPRNRKSVNRLTSIWNRCKYTFPILEDYCEGELQNAQRDNYLKQA